MVLGAGRRQPQDTDADVGWTQLPPSPGPPQAAAPNSVVGPTARDLSPGSWGGPKPREPQTGLQHRQLVPGGIPTGHRLRAPCTGWRPLPADSQGLSRR